MEEPQLCVSSATVLGADLDDCPQLDSDFNIGQSSDLFEKHTVLLIFHWP